MQLMVKDKILYFLLPISLVIFYFCYVVYDHFYFDDHGVREIIETRNLGIKTSSDQIDGIIIGGSNALWGISAKNLSKDSSINFYNLAMHSNGVNYKNYFEYIKSSLTPSQALEVKYIFWSTIQSIHEPPWNDFDRDIFGRLRLSKLIPNQSVLSFLYKRFTRQESVFYEVDKNYGDFIFDNFKCTLSDSRYINSSDINLAQSGSYQLVNLQKLELQLKVYQEFFQSYFPNAAVIFVIPSTLHEINLSLFEKKELVNILNAFNMKLHIQSQLNDIKYFCESDHHPNELGRNLRTRDLTKFMKILAQELN